MRCPSTVFGFIALVRYCMLIANRGSAVSYTSFFVVTLEIYVMIVGLPLA